MTKPYCCEATCTKDAEYRVTDVGVTAERYGGTDACAEHLGALVSGLAHVEPLAE